MNKFLKNVFEWGEYSLGIDVREKIVVGVLLRRSLFGLKIVNTFTLPIESDEVETVDKMVGQIRNKNILRNLEVNLCKKGNSVFHSVQKIPIGISKNEIDSWLTEHSQEYSPIGISEEDFSNRNLILSISESYYEVLVSFIRKNSIQDFESKNLTESENISYIGAYPLDLPLSLMLSDDSILRTNSAFIDIDSKRVTIVIYKNGIHSFDTVVSHDLSPESESELKSKSTANEEKKLSLKSKLLDVIQVYWEKNLGMEPVKGIFLSGDTNLVNMEENALKEKLPAQIAEPLTGLRNSVQKLSSIFTNAASLALKRFYPSIGSPNHKSDMGIERVSQLREKRFSIRALAFIIIISISASLGLELTYRYFTTQKHIVDSSLSELEVETIQINRLKNATKQLRAFLRKYSRLEESRSYTRWILNRLGKASVNLVTFNRLEINEIDKNNSFATRPSYEMTIRGFGNDRMDISRFMRKIEKEKFARNVELLELRQYSGSEMVKLVSNHDKPAIGFEVKITSY